MEVEGPLIKPSEAQYQATKLPMASQEGGLSSSDLAVGVRVRFRWEAAAKICFRDGAEGRAVGDQMDLRICVFLGFSGCLLDGAFVS